MTAIAFLLAAALLAAPPVGAAPLEREFAREVDLRLRVPRPVADAYAARLAAALESAGVMPEKPQYYVLVDRSARVQAAFVYWYGLDGRWQLVGASPVSTGNPGEFAHFATPLGVFAHSPGNMDFRAEGTANDFGILGYGERGMRVRFRLGRRRARLGRRRHEPDAAADARHRPEAARAAARRSRADALPGRWLVVVDSARAQRPAWVKRVRR